MNVTEQGAVLIRQLLFSDLFMSCASALDALEPDERDALDRTSPNPGTTLTEKMEARTVYAASVESFLDQLRSRLLDDPEVGSLELGQVLDGGFVVALAGPDK